MDRVKKPRKGIIDIFASIGDFFFDRSQKRRDEKNRWKDGYAHYDPKTGKRVWAPERWNPGLYERGENGGFVQPVKPTRWYSSHTINKNGREHQQIKADGGYFTSGMASYETQYYKDVIREK